MLSLIPIETFPRDCGGLLFAPLTQFPPCLGSTFSLGPRSAWTQIVDRNPLATANDWLFAQLIDTSGSPASLKARGTSETLEHDLEKFSQTFVSYQTVLTTLKIFMYTAILFEVQTLTFKHKSHGHTWVQNFEPNCVDKSNTWTILSDIRQSKANPSALPTLAWMYFILSFTYPMDIAIKAAEEKKKIFQNVWFFSWGLFNIW